MNCSFFFCSLLICILFSLSTVPLHVQDQFILLIGEFKFRYNNYTTSFKNEHSGQSTTLKTYYWKMKKERKNPKVSFEILRVVPSFTPEVGRCALCTAEKLAILKADPKKTLIKRSEIMSICRHKRKFILEYAKINP